jgi:hypothetical protein
MIETHGAGAGLLQNPSRPARGVEKQSVDFVKQDSNLPREKAHQLLMERRLPFRMVHFPFDGMESSKRSVKCIVDPAVVSAEALMQIVDIHSDFFQKPEAVVLIVVVARVDAIDGHSVASLLQFPCHGSQMIDVVKMSDKKKKHPRTRSLLNAFRTL